MKRLLLTFGIALFAASTACGPKPAPRGQPAERPETTLLRADHLVEQGCYLCLGEAAALYRELLHGGFRPALVGDRLFRAEILMTLREREVGIVPPARLEGADATAAQPARSGAVPYRDMALAVPWSVSTGIRDLPEIPTPPLADAGDPFAAYVLAALDCSYAASTSPAPDLRRYAAANPAWLGLAFRVAICRSVDEATLRDLVAREPRFVEADFLLGELRARKRETAEAERLYRRVVERLPRLVAASVALGDLLAEGEEFEAALDPYDQALDVVPDHRSALLGRVRCLSNLERHQEALGVCDTIIRLGEWYLGPAYYWRAWNLYALQELKAASEAIEAAKQYVQTAEVFDLAGVIAFDEGHFEQARSDLQEALRRNRNMCRPRFYLGRVDAEADQWVAAGVSFAQSMDCYALGAGAAAEKLDEVRASTSLAEVRRARLMDRYRKQGIAAQHAAALAAYHAAVSYANADMREVAIAHAERALADEQLKTQVQELLAKLRKSADSRR